MGGVVCSGLDRREHADDLARDHVDAPPGGDRRSGEVMEGHLGVVQRVEDNLFEVLLSWIATQTSLSRPRNMRMSRSGPRLHQADQESISAPSKLSAHLRSIT